MSGGPGAPRGVLAQPVGMSRFLQRGEVPRGLKGLSRLPGCGRHPGDTLCPPDSDGVSARMCTVLSITSVSLGVAACHGLTSSVHICSLKEPGVPLIAQKLTSSSIARRVLNSSFAAAIATPHGVDRYVEMIDPLWSSAEIRAEVTDVERKTADSVTLTLRPNNLWTGFKAGQFVKLSVEIATSTAAAGVWLRRALRDLEGQGADQRRGAVTCWLYRQRRGGRTAPRALRPLDRAARASSHPALVPARGQRLT